MHLENESIAPMLKPRKSVQKACIYILSFLSFCTALEAVAADWTSISKTKQEEMLVDMDSYNESAGMPYITTKTLFLKPQNYRKNALKFIYSESHSTTQFNCALHTFKTNAMQFFDANKKLVGSEIGDDFFKPVAANSKDAALESLVCQVHKMVGGN
ncbi:surface-adhesin E family protein [Methylotenera versatilis]|uniref:surface-adhesin E family protein n=1 Tax=Methylotenera versatilis TaxID=1055487 RepID=UPI000647E193|nr:surface-adhesin E family protein [Methylotenera versatilis]